MTDKLIHRMINEFDVQQMFIGYYYHHQQVIDRIEFDETKTDQTMDINKAL